GAGRREEWGEGRAEGEGRGETKSRRSPDEPATIGLLCCGAIIGLRYDAATLCGATGTQRLDCVATAKQSDCAAVIQGNSPESQRRPASSRAQGLRMCHLAEQRRIHIP